VESKSNSQKKKKKFTKKEKDFNEGYHSVIEGQSEDYNSSESMICHTQEKKRKKTINETKSGFFTRKLVTHSSLLKHDDK
jgi:hypothetical protein